MNKFKYIKTFSEIDKNDIASVGGKGANLGEMVKAGFPVPEGFAVTAQAYFHFIKVNELKDKLKAELSLIDKNDPASYQRVSANIKKAMNGFEFPKEIAREIFLAYENVVGLLGGGLVAVRSSATAEDLPDASFAGQQETFLNIKGEANLIQKIKACWASLFTARAIFYREEKKFDHIKVGLSAIVQKMIQSQVSGVMFTVNPVTNDKRVYVIEAILGLGELIVQGSETPDHYEIDKTKMKITQKVIGAQNKKMIKKGNKNVLIKLSKKLSKKQKLSDGKIIELAKLGKKLHQHYFFPQDIEWGLENNKLYILQTRPVTTLQNPKAKADSPKLAENATKNLKILIKGDAASPGIASGFAKVIFSHKDINKIKDGEVLVTTMTTPDFVPAMKKASAIVTDKGGQTSHAAIVSRELGVPCVVGTTKGSKVIKNGVVITINGTTGEVFKGGITAKKPEDKFLTREAKNTAPISSSFPVLKTATKLYLNLAEPELAEKHAAANVDGVGLLRAEFMIAQIGVHPRKMIADGKGKLFVDHLSEGIGKMCKAFAPRPVVYRTTDFKTSEYANLKGGKEFEGVEGNPLIGFRGAYRYIVDEKVFCLELDAIKKIRNKMGLKNLWVMIPFIRTVDELVKVKKIITSHGLSRSPSFKLWMMVEIPSNVILLDDFIDAGIDGVSIGSNDLTMLMLGLDRDNEKISKEFDERNPAVLWALEKTIKTCQKRKVSSSICGQAPSQYPSLMEKLISWGITSISVSPDIIDSGRKIIYEAERKLVNEKK